MKQINPATVMRDENGYWMHPQLPDFSTSPDLGEIQKWLTSQNITATRLIALLEQPMLPHHIIEAAQLSGDISKVPLPELSRTWFLLGIINHDDGPKAWYATRAEVGQIAPPRPEITTNMVEFVSKQLITQLKKMQRLHGDESDSLGRLVNGYVDGMTDAEIYSLMFPGHQLAEESTDVSEAVSNYTILLRQQRQAAERKWVSRHAVVPEVNLGKRVKFRYLGEHTLGLLVGNDYEHGRHLIQVEGKTRLINMPYERVTPA